MVNCIILGRAEAFAYKNGIYHSLIDAIGMGAGFTATLMLLGAVREFFGNGTIWGVTLTPASFHPAIIMILPPGAFITLGLMIAAMNFIVMRRERLAREKRHAELRAKRRAV